MDIANHMIVAVMFPWLTMYAKPTDAPWMMARTVDSFGLNSNPILTLHLLAVVAVPSVRNRF